MNPLIILTNRSLIFQSLYVPKYYIESQFPRARSDIFKLLPLLNSQKPEGSLNDKENQQIVTFKKQEPDNDDIFLDYQS